MNSSQLAAITKMNLTSADIQSLADEKGSVSSTTGTQTSVTTQSSGMPASSGAMSGGGAPAGGDTMGGMSFGEDQISQLVSATTTSSATTSSAQVITSKSTSKVTLTLVDVLITKLQSL
jgi:hypothetical protein